MGIGLHRKTNKERLMPIFEYKCEKCGDVVEEIVSIKDNVTTPKCKVCGIDMKRIVSLSTFHLKGKGWYKDGY